MTISYFPFAPTTDSVFQFTPTLDGTQYTCVVTWNTFGQRWGLNIYTLQGKIVLRKPLTPSPDNADINLVQGYFKTSTLVYRFSTDTFAVSP